MKKQPPALAQILEGGGRDWFGELRGDEELARLVTETIEREERPYAALWSRLVGAAPDIDELEARVLWVTAVQRKRELTAWLGRPVHLRVAALDMLYGEKAGRLRPRLVTRQVVSQLLQDTAVDTLTGLSNREHLATIVHHELGRRKVAPLALAFFDLEGFERLEASSGEEVLKRVGAALTRLSRPGDVCARLAGDQFAALFVDMPPRQATAAARRLEQELERDLAAFEVGVSARLFSPLQGEDGAAFLARATQETSVARKARAGQVKKERAALQAEAAAPPLALYATNLADRFLEVQQALAELGVMVLPAIDGGTAEILWKLMRPRWVLADVMLSPRGGEALGEAGPAEAPARFALVAPRRWRTMRTGVGETSVLRVPLERSAVARFLGPLPAQAALQPQVVEPRLMMKVIARLVAGVPISNTVPEGVLQLAEVLTVKRLLGS